MPGFAISASLLLCVTAVSYAQAVPTILPTASHELVLPPTMGRLIQTTIPGFRPWQIGDYTPDIQRYYEFSPHQTPWAVVGDFNGDSVTDLVLEGSDDSSAYRICLLSVPGDTGFTLLTLVREQRALPGTKANVLLYQAPTHLTSSFGEPDLDLRADGFHDYYFEKAATLFYWQDGSFHEFTSAD